MAITKTQFLSCSRRAWLEKQSAKKSPEVPTAENPSEITMAQQSIHAASEELLQARSLDNPYFRRAGYEVEELAAKHSRLIGAQIVPYLYGREAFTSTHELLRSGNDTLSQPSFTVLDLGTTRLDFLTKPSTDQPIYAGLLSEEDSQKAIDLIDSLLGSHISITTENGVETYELNSFADLYNINEKFFTNLSLSTDTANYNLKQILEILNPKWKRQTKKVISNIQLFQSVILEKALKGCYGTTILSQANEIKNKIILDITGGLYGSDREIIEVKSTNSPEADKPHRPKHIDDVAVSFLLTRLSGTPVKVASLMMLDRDYRLPESSDASQISEIDPNQIFKIYDVTPEVIARLPHLYEEFKAKARIIENPTPPEGILPTSSLCHFRDTSQACPYLDTCYTSGFNNSEGIQLIESLPTAPLQILPRITESKLEEFNRLGVDSVDQINLINPLEGQPKLSPIQSAIVTAFTQGPMVDKEVISKTLDQIGDRFSILDFETLTHALPRFAGRGPNATTPFQYAVLREEAGVQTTRTFLAPSDKFDPSQTLIENLLNDLLSSGAVIVWDKYEAGIIKSLAQRFPQYSTDLLAIVDRIVDLRKPFELGLVLKEFYGSTSLKMVAPQIAPHMSYDNQAIQNGLMSQAYFEAANRSQDPAQILEYRSMLEKYNVHDVRATHAALLHLQGVLNGTVNY